MRGPLRRFRIKGRWTPFGMLECTREMKERDGGRQRRVVKYVV